MATLEHTRHHLRSIFIHRHSPSDSSTDDGHLQSNPDPASYPALTGTRHRLTGTPNSSTLNVAKSLKAFVFHADLPSNSNGPSETEKTPAPVASTNTDNDPPQITDPPKSPKSKSFLRHITTKLRLPIPPPDFARPPRPSTLTNSIVAPGQREAALRERGLLPPLPKKDLSELEQEQDRRLGLAPLPELEAVQGNSDDRETEAKRIMNEWKANNERQASTAVASGDESEQKLVSAALATADLPDTNANSLALSEDPHHLSDSLTDDVQQSTSDPDTQPSGTPPPPPQLSEPKNPEPHYSPPSPSEGFAPTDTPSQDESNTPPVVELHPAEELLLPSEVQLTPETPTDIAASPDRTGPPPALDPGSEGLTTPTATPLQDESNTPPAVELQEVLPQSEVQPTPEVQTDIAASADRTSPPPTLDQASSGSEGLTPTATPSQDESPAIELRPAEELLPRSEVQHMPEAQTDIAVSADPPPAVDLASSESDLNTTQIPSLLTTELPADPTPQLELPSPDAGDGTPKAQLGLAKPVPPSISLTPPESPCLMQNKPASVAFPSPELECAIPLVLSVSTPSHSPSSLSPISPSHSRLADSRGRTKSSPTLPSLSESSSRQSSSLVTPPSSFDDSHLPLVGGVWKDGGAPRLSLRLQLGDFDLSKIGMVMESPVEGVEPLESGGLEIESAPVGDHDVDVAEAALAEEDHRVATPPTEIRVSSPPEPETERLPAPVREERGATDSGGPDVRKSVLNFFGKRRKSLNLGDTPGVGTTSASSSTSLVSLAKNPSGEGTTSASSSTGPVASLVKDPSTIRGFSSLRRSFGGLTLGRPKANALGQSPPLSPTLTRNIRSPRGGTFDASHLPPSPTIPAHFVERRATEGDGEIPMRQALDIKYHSRGSILLSASKIEDAESRRLSEMAFLM